MPATPQNVVASNSQIVNMFLASQVVRLRNTPQHRRGGPQQPLVGANIQAEGDNQEQLAHFKAQEANHRRTLAVFPIVIQDHLRDLIKNQVDHIQSAQLS